MSTNLQNRWLKFDRMLTGSLWKQFLWITSLLIITWMLSYLCLSFSGTDWVQFCTAHGVKTWMLPLYLLIDANAFNNLYYSETPDTSIHGWMLVISCITYLIGLLIFNGIIISIISNYLAQRKENYINGMSYYAASGHYVIMGYDDMVPSVIADIFRRDSNAHIIVLSEEESVFIREQLRNTIKREFFSHIVVNYGHRTARDYYSDIYLEKAKEIFVIGKRELPCHDAENVECVESILDYLEMQNNKSKPKRITCVFEDYDTYSAFKLADIFEKARTLHIDFVPYNYYVGWAKQVFLARHYYSMHDDTCHEYPSVYRNGIGLNDSHYVHLVFVGTSTLAYAFAMEAAQILHFPNGTSYAIKATNLTPIKTKITFIDQNAYSEMLLFRTRNRHFFDIQSCYYQDATGDKPKQQVIPPSIFEGLNSNFLDVDFEFIQGDIYSDCVQQIIRTWTEDENQYVSIFLTQSNQRDNFCLGMNMPDAVYNHGIPIFIQQDKSDTFVTRLRQAHTKHKQRYAEIYPFGMNDTAFYYSDTDEKRAQLINFLYETADYEAYHFKDIHILEGLSKEQILSDAQNFWNKLQVSLKWSNSYAAETIPCKLSSMNTIQKESPSLKEIEQIECMAEVEHNRWNVEKLIMGYSKPIINDKQVFNKRNYNFVHPNICPYSQLGDASKWDIEFIRHIQWIVQTEKQITKLYKSI